MGVVSGSAQEFIDPLDQPFGNGMLEFLRFVMDFGPIEPEHADEKELDQAVSAQDVKGELLAGGGKAHALARFVADEAGIGEGLDHGGDGAGDDIHGGGKAAEGYEIEPGLLFEVDAFDVIFDGAGRHGR